MFFICSVNIILFIIYFTLLCMSVGVSTRCFIIVATKLQVKFNNFRFSIDCAPLMFKARAKFWRPE